MNSDPCGEIQKQFLDRGLRLTTPRRIILQRLGEAADFISAETLHQSLNSPGIGMATVYRTLGLLTDMGLVTKLEFGEGRFRYKITEDQQGLKHHHLLVCNGCFKVMKYSDFSREEETLLHEVQKVLEERHGYRIEKHLVQFYGLCPDCQ